MFIIYYYGLKNVEREKTSYVPLQPQPEMNVTTSPLLITKNNTKLKHFSHSCKENPRLPLNM